MQRELLHRPSLQIDRRDTFQRPGEACGGEWTDHAEQACDAAVEMRVGLREAAAVPTSVGRLSLSMSVGVHSGDVALFLVGEPTRELLVLGPAATETRTAVRTQNPGRVAGSGSISVLKTAGRFTSRSRT